VIMAGTRRHALQQQWFLHMGLGVIGALWFGWVEALYIV